MYYLCYYRQIFLVVQIIETSGSMYCILDSDGMKVMTNNMTRWGAKHNDPALPLSPLHATE